MQLNTASSILVPKSTFFHKVGVPSEEFTASSGAVCLTWSCSDGSVSLWINGWQYSQDMVAGEHLSTLKSRH